MSQSLSKSSTQMEGIDAPLMRGRRLTLGGKISSSQFRVSDPIDGFQHGLSIGKLGIDASTLILTCIFFAESRPTKELLVVFT